MLCTGIILMAKKTKNKGSAELLAALKFVKASLAKKNIVAANTHFNISTGLIRAYNGSLAMSAKIPLDITCKPLGKPFIKAIENCKGTVALSLTAAGKLRVTDGRFKALIPCTDDPTPTVEPEGEIRDLDGEKLMSAIKKVLPLVGNDASKQWTNGILLDGEYLYATNNVILIQHWLQTYIPFRMNVHREALNEMVRIGANPISVQCSATSVTFHYEDERWIRVALIDPQWPNFGKWLDVANTAIDIDPLIFEGLETIKPFVDDMGSIFFENGMIKTHLHDDKEGATFDVPNLPPEGRFSLAMMQLLEGVVTKIDWSMYPSPCIFYGENLRGAIVGLRMI